MSNKTHAHWKHITSQVLIFYLTSDRTMASSSSSSLEHVQPSHQNTDIRWTVTQ